MLCKISYICSYSDMPLDPLGAHRVDALPYICVEIGVYSPLVGRAFAGSRLRNGVCCALQLAV